MKGLEAQLRLLRNKEKVNLYNIVKKINKMEWTNRMLQSKLCLVTIQIMTEKMVLWNLKHSSKDNQLLLLLLFGWMTINQKFLYGNHFWFFRLRF